MPDVEHYLRLVPPQHNRPRFIKWLTVNLTILHEVEQLLRTYDHEFDLDYAIGTQLDVIGQIVGRNRLLDFDPSDGSGALLDDDMYRIVLKAKIGLNHWDGTESNALDLWNNLLPQYQLVIFDHQDMSIDIVVIGLVTELEKELMGRGYFTPKPEGVRVNYNFGTETEFETAWLYVGGTVWPCITSTTLPPYYPQYDFPVQLGVGAAAWSIMTTEIPQYTPWEFKDEINVAVAINTVLETTLPPIT